MKSKNEKNYINNEEVIYEASKSFRPYLELFLGVLIGLILVYFQHNNIHAFDTASLIFIGLGLCFILLQSLDFFFLKILLTKNNIYIKSVFTIGKYIKIGLKRVKSIKVSNVYFKNKSNQGVIFLTIHNWLPIPIGIINDANSFKKLLENINIKEK